jgi:hypothetical protein
MCSNSKKVGSYVNPATHLAIVAYCEFCEDTNSIGKRMDSQVLDRIEPAEQDGSSGKRVDQGRVDLES